MAVAEQTPYIEYTANGATTSFALGFDCESKDHLIVLIDDIEPPIATWSLTGGNVVFTTAPAAGKKITLQRNTPFSRTTDYQSYNNSFRPPAVNTDFDWIWWKLQELGVADWILSNRIDALKNYVDDRDDELRAYLMEEIRKQGVALDQLDEYYNYLMQRLAEIAVNAGWEASFVVDASGKTQQQINDNQKDINTILNKTGTTETLAESVDATPFLQSLINAMPDGMTLDLLGKTFRVKKNTGFTSDYPNGDQPCLVIKDKKNITITNGKLIVKEHAQTAIDCIDSTGVINGLTIEGAGNFPPLYGTTGRGEKGDASAGYFDLTFSNTGYPRNNSVDTTGYSGGNYGGSFPQWGGGTASTWGAWNGGYIANFGDGVYLKNSTFTLENCDIYGFNGNGVTIVEGSLFVKRSKLHDCYTAGALAKSFGEGAGKIIEFYSFEENQIYNMGHPNSEPSDDWADPGYGISTSNTGAAIQGVQNYIAEKNIFRNCKRKAVDAHHSYVLQVHNNIIEDCGIGVQVAIADFGRYPAYTSVTNNIMRRIRLSVLAGELGISVAPNNTNQPFKGFVNIQNNTIEELGKTVANYNANKARAVIGYNIIVGNIECPIISGNTILVGSDSVANAGISDGQATANFTPRSIISENYIRGALLFGILSRKNTSNTSNATLENWSVVTSNIVDITPRLDSPSTPAAIFTDKSTVVRNNQVVPRSGVTKYGGSTYWKDDLVSFEVNIVTGAVSNVVNSELTNFTPASFVVTKTTNKVEITIPPSTGFDLDERAILATASTYGVRYESGSSTPTKLSLGLYSTTGAAVNASDITRGVFKVTLTLA